MYNYKRQIKRIVNTGLAVLIALSGMLGSRTVYADELCKEDIMRTVYDYAVAQDNPYPYFHFNMEKINFKQDETVEVKLLDRDDAELDAEIFASIKWYILSRSPYDDIATIEESEDSAHTLLIAEKDIDSHTVSLRAKTDLFTEYDRRGYVVAVYEEDGENYIHKLDYDINKAEDNRQNEREAQVEEKVQEIVKNIQHLSDIEKARYLYEYLAENVEYDLDYRGRPNLYNTLIEERAVCHGYALAYKYLLDQVGIESQVVLGHAGEYHAWNRVRLDDGWYYVDPTWANAGGLRYRYFMVDYETISINHNRFIHNGDALQGSKYLFYQHIKDGNIANNKEELRRIADRALDSFTSEEKDITLIIPSDISPHEVEEMLIGESLNGQEFKKRYALNSFHHNISRSYPTYYVYTFYINAVNYNARAVSADISVENSDENHALRKISINLSEPIELADHNINISNASKVALHKRSTSEYELEIADIIGDNMGEVNISIAKTGYDITVHNNPISLPIVKADKPEVKFIGTDAEHGKFINIEDGIKYSLGDGVWHDADEDVEVVPRISVPIYVRREEAGKENSDIQLINVKTQNRPDWIRTVAASPSDAVTKVNTNMEYRNVSEDSEFITIEKDDLVRNTLVGLPAGEYEFRLKGREGVLASETYTVIVNEASEEDEYIPENQPELESQPEPEIQPEFEHRTEQENQPEPDGQTEQESQPEPDGQTEQESQPEPEGQTEQETQPESESRTEQETQPESESRTEKESQSKSESQTEQDKRTETKRHSDNASNSGSRSASRRSGGGSGGSGGSSRRSSGGAGGKKTSIKARNTSNTGITQTVYIDSRAESFASDINEAWRQNGDSTWSFINNGGKVKLSWLRYNNNWYFLDKDGKMLSNVWLWYDNSWFFIKGNGTMLDKEWVKLDSKWYYAKEGGYIAQNNKLFINNVWYEFNALGEWIE